MWEECAYSRRNAGPGTSLQDLLRLDRRKRFGRRKDLSRRFRYVFQKSEFFWNRNRRGSVGQLITVCIVCLSVRINCTVTPLLLI